MAIFSALIDNTKWVRSGTTLSPTNAGDDVSTTGTGIFGALTIDTTLTISSGLIEDSGGTISFGSTNLSTTGTLAAGATTLTVAADPQLTLQFDVSNFAIFEVDASGNLVIEPSGASTRIGDNISITGAVISSSTGAISFADENLSTTGTLTVASDTDATTILGRAKIFSADSDVAFFSHFDHASTTNYALNQDSTGNTFVNAPTGKVVEIRINDVTEYQFSATAADLGTNNLVTTGNIDIGSTGWMGNDAGNAFTMAAFVPTIQSNGSVLVFTDNNNNDTSSIWGLYKNGLTVGTSTLMVSFNEVTGADFTSLNIITTGGVTAGASTFGDGGVTNYFAIDATGNIGFNGSAEVETNMPFADAVFPILDKASGNGIKVDTTAPTFGFADLLGDQFSKNTGGTKPTLTAYNGAVDAWQFTNGDEAFLSYHIPHDYVKGTDIFLHVHWSQNAAGATGGTLDFKYFAIYAKGWNQAAGSAFTTTPITATFSSIDINDGGAGLTQYQHHLTEVQITAATATAALFDRDDLEPDGVIELTLEMDADNLTGTPSSPFIHYVDIHYQTTGLIGTKSREPDFYA